MPCCLPFCTSDPLALVRLYPTATATTECVYVNTTAVALQHNSDGREQHSSRPATAESSTPADQRRQSAALQQISGDKVQYSNRSGRQNAALQHNSDDREQHSSRPAATECSTPTDQRQEDGRRTVPDTRAGSKTIPD